MNYIDMFILVLLGWAIFRGFIRGFVMQVSTLAALVIGVYGAIKLSGLTAHEISKQVEITEEYLYVISLILTFIIVFFLIHLLGKLLEKVVKTARLSFMNKILGIVFSLAKTILIIGIILTVIERIDNHVPFMKKGSKEYSIFFEPFTSLVQTIFPGLGIDSPEIPEQERENLQNNKTDGVVVYLPLQKLVNS